MIRRIRKYHKIKPGLCSIQFWTFTEEQLENPSTEDLRKFIDEQFNHDKYGEVCGLFRDLVNCEIKPGEKMEDFVTRFNSIYLVLSRRDK